jgi:FtsZ-interacting cell division protein ZipA
MTGTQIAVVVAGVFALAAFLFVRWLMRRERRAGHDEANASRDIADARETITAHEVRNDVEDRIARGGDAKHRLRSDWRE